MSALIFNLKGTDLDNAIATMEDQIQYSFKNRDLLLEAITHPSAASEMPQPSRHNQRLEFLGDAVLQIILSEYLFQKDQNAQEGILTRMRSFLAKEEATADYAIRLGLDRILQLGHGECVGGGRTKSSILGDLFEAFLGALYLDAGYDTARDLCLSLLPSIDSVKDSLVLDENPKGAFQELCQERHCGNPEYRQLAKSGPVHSPVYTVGVFIHSTEIARGNGNSLRNAEKHAARAAWLKLGKKKETTSSYSDVIYALDFDGVICDSVRETAIAGWMGAHSIWPELFPQERPSEEKILAFKKVRPFLETGFETILLTKMIQEEIPFEEYQRHFKEHVSRIMEESHLDRPALISLFGGIRDRWIQQDQQDWLAAHGFFDGVLPALNAALASGKRLYILTTKQERFVQATLESQGVNFPVENIYGLDRKCKKEVLLAEFLKGKPREIHFVEDRIQTLLRVETVPELDSVNLHYATWGYGTPQDQEIAADDPHIHLFSLPEFCQWLEE